MKELGKGTESNETNQRKLSIKNEEIVRNLSELQAEEDGRKIFSPSRKDSETMLRMRAETAGERLLGVEDASKFLHFLDFYVEILRNCGETVYSDEKIFKAFELFDGNVKKSSEFLAVAEELEELGFEEEKVVSVFK